MAFTFLSSSLHFISKIPPLVQRPQERPTSCPFSAKLRFQGSVCSNFNRWSEERDLGSLVRTGAPLTRRHKRCSQGGDGRLPQRPALNPLLEGVVNTRIPADGNELLAHVAWPKETPLGKESPVVIVIHEFYGLHPDICGKAEALAEELNCLAIAPDTYRGDCTRFVPKAIYLALTTPQDRVDKDLEAVISWAAQQHGVDINRIAIIGFCYGGGKAIRFSCKTLPTAKATVVFYGRPLTDTAALANLKGEVLGIFGEKDGQFPVKMVQEFEQALIKAGVRHKISIYENQGHAFFTNMDQVKAGQGPQRRAWEELIAFLKRTLA